MLALGVSLSLETGDGEREGEQGGRAQGEPSSEELAESEPRLRLESHRRRRLFALRREYLARADRLNGLARSAAEGDDEATSDRLGRLAESLEERAAQIERQLAALAGSGLEIVGSPRPARGERTEVTLVEREGTVRLIIESPAGGAEFPLP